MNSRIPDINETAPEFTAVAENGLEFDLKRELQKGGHILLVFYRGHW